MKLQELLGIELPDIQAPMAGVQGSALAVAVCSGEKQSGRPSPNVRQTTKRKSIIHMQEIETDKQKLVNKRTIALRYGITQRTVQEWMAKEMIPYFKLGYIVRFDPEACDRALAQFEVNAATEAFGKD